MFHMLTPSSRKFIAVLMLLWLPLFSGSALAATVSMQVQQGHCHEAVASQAMPGMDMSEHHGVADGQNHSCSTSGVCHLACTVYLALTSVELITVQAAAHEIPTTYLVSFHSVTSAPLVPPPLARA